MSEITPYIIAFVVGLSILTYLLTEVKLPKKEEGEGPDWYARVKNAKLGKQGFESAGPEKKWNLLYYFVQKIRTQDNYDRPSFDNMPKPLQVFNLIDDLEGEVNNGGFLQFFTNSSGGYISETLEALELIGAPYTQGLLEEASRILAKHNTTVESLHSKIAGLDLHQIIQSGELYDNDAMLDEMKSVDMKFYESTEILSDLSIKYFEDNQEGLWEEIQMKYP